jgi:hypothetical protein
MRRPPPPRGFSQGGNWLSPRVILVLSTFLILAFTISNTRYLQLGDDDEDGTPPFGLGLLCVFFFFGEGYKKKRKFKPRKEKNIWIVVGACVLGWSPTNPKKKKAESFLRLGPFLSSCCVFFVCFRCLFVCLFDVQPLSALCSSK